jgi:hypothetical protein
MDLSQLVTLARQVVESAAHSHTQSGVPGKIPE